jgi:hypothetical protein
VQKGHFHISVFAPVYASQGAPLPPEPGLLDLIGLPRRTIPGSVVCAALIVGIHVAFLEPFLAAAPTNRTTTATLAGATFDSGDSSMQVILIDPSDSAPPAPPLLAVTSEQLTPAILHLVIDPPSNLLLEDEDHSDSVTSPTDEVGDSKLAGRYLGQLNARVERAWIKPQTAIGSPVFSCTVEVHQDPLGNILKTTLLTCNGTPAWQQSLLAAIHSASPFPAAPDPSLVRRRLRLQFESTAVVAAARLN